MAVHRQDSVLKRLLAAGSLTQPLVLRSWSCGATGFWTLYEVLAPFRNQLTQGGSFALKGDVLQMRDRSGALLVLSDVAQGAYARFVCRVAEHALNEQQFAVREALLAENDLYELRMVHQIANFSARGFRFSSSLRTCYPGRAPRALLLPKNSLPFVDVYSMDIRQFRQS